MSFETKKLILSLFFVSIVKCVNSQGSSSPTCDTRTNKVMQCDLQRCGTIFTCLPGLSTPHKITKCSNDTPYCNVGRYGDFCTDVMESSNVHFYEIGTFNCSKPGFYPSERHLFITIKNVCKLLSAKCLKLSISDVFECQSYYYCNGNEPTALPRFCPAGYYFNARTFSCVRLLSKAQCYKSKCTELGLFPYEPNLQLFYSCSGSSLLLPLIHRCDANEVFKNNVCTYLCRTSGLFAHEDSTRYYQCYRNGPRFSYLIRSCGTKTFNPVLRRCDN